MNIGANAHGKRTVSTKQPQLSDKPDSWVSSDIGASFQVSKLIHSVTVSQPDHCFHFTRLITRMKSSLVCLFVYLLFCALYWCQAAEGGYFGVLNVAHVLIILISIHSKRGCIRPISLLLKGTSWFRDIYRFDIWVAWIFRNAKWLWFIKWYLGIITNKHFPIFTWMSKCQYQIIIVMTPSVEYHYQSMS